MQKMFKKAKNILVASLLMCPFVGATAETTHTIAQLQAQGQFVSLTFHDVRDDVATNGDRDLYAINTKNLAQFFSWLQHSDWTVIHLEDVWQARQNNKPLPEKALLLTFDDGALSSYQRVYPLLKQYQIPAVFAIVTSWINGNNKDAYDAYGQGNLMTWQDMREMQKSGLVEFASHSNRLHQGVLANPQNNSEPAAITRQYNSTSNTYESDAAYHQRIYDDLKKSKQILDHELGIQTKAIFWPYGAVTGETEQIAKQAGLPMSFSLGNVSSQATSAQTYQRSIILNNPSAEEIDIQMQDFLLDIKQPSRSYKRMVGINPAELINDNRQMTDDALGKMLNQLNGLQTNLMVVQVVNPDKQTNTAFFPTSQLPFIDVLNRIVWQAKTRIGHQVYAALPMHLQTEQDVQISNLSKDLFKNNSSLDGVVLDTENNMNCAIEQRNIDQNCENKVMQVYKIKEQIKSNAKQFINISTNFRTALKLKPQNQHFDGLENLVVTQPDLLYIELNPLTAPHIFKAFLKAAKPLSALQKQQLLVNFDLAAQSDKDWKAYKKAYQELKMIGVQKIGIANYELDYGQAIHQQLYTDLSLNESALTYKDPYASTTFKERK